MSPLTLGNLAAWCIQAALIVGAGLTTLWLVRLEAPAVRYLFLRGLLAMCLTLPLVQPQEGGNGLASGLAADQAGGDARRLDLALLAASGAIAGSRSQ